MYSPDVRGVCIVFPIVFPLILSTVDFFTLVASQFFVRRIERFPTHDTRTGYSGYFRFPGESRHARDEIGVETFGVVADNLFVLSQDGART